MEDSKVNIITKTDKELVQERIAELEANIKAGRNTGKTYRVINKIIDDFFNKPIGTKIALVDGKPTNDSIVLQKFILKLVARLKSDFPDMNFKITYEGPGVAFIERTTETYQETAKKRLEQWKVKLAEL